MSEINLKNYKKYMKDLTKYADAINVTITYKDYPDQGVYNPRGRSITIDSNMSEADEISTILHELGHCIDMDFMSKKEEKVFDRAYGRIYTTNYTKSDYKEVLRREKKAWHVGRIIAKILRIPLGAWYTEGQDEALASYKTLAKK